MNKEIKTIGVFFSIMMLVGSVVGIGIFFKNNSIAEATNHNGLSWLLAWVLGGIISISTALCFGEIGSFQNTKLSGISNWTYKIAGKKLGYFISSSYTLFYYGLLTTVIGVFGSEIFFYFIANIADLDFSKVFPVWVHIITGVCISIIFILLNFVSVYISGFLQSIVTIIKFVPLLFALFVGIIFPNNHSLNGLNAFFINSFSFKATIVVLPAVLFSYDAFLISGSIGIKITNSSKNLPKVIIMGMFIVTTFYTLIAISSILHNQGTIDNLILDSLIIKNSDVVVKIILFFLIISTFGVINGLAGGFINEIENMVKSQLFFGSNFLTKKYGSKKTILITMLGIIFIWSVLTFIPSLIINSDILIDAYTNFVVAIFFGVYALIIFLYSIKRKTITETKKINNYVYFIMAFISIFGILVSEIGYILTTISFIFEPQILNPAKWGLFITNNKELIKSYFPFLLNIIFIILFILFPTINYYLEKQIFKNNILKDFEKLINIQ